MVPSISHATLMSANKTHTRRYAAIDIGTVTCRMLLADVDATGALHEVRREYAITNLGEGVDATRKLKPEAMQRVAKVIKGYQRILDENPSPDGRGIKVIALATSASRDAENAAEFVDMLAGLGITLSVISGDQEAALSFAGASAEFSGEHIFVVDIGGGSTEVVAGSAGCEPHWSHSFDVGCRRITEKFLRADPPLPAELARAREEIAETMRPYFAAIQSDGFIPERLVAVAGTATSVVSIHQQMKVYDSARVHKAIINRAVLLEICQRLSLLPLNQRREIVGLDPDRAPVMVAGLIILDVIMELAKTDSFTVSESDILQGIILHAAK